MLRLTYKTRKDSDPHDLPRVFASCCCEEQWLCLLPLINMLHQVMNCAVYYAEEASDDADMNGSVEFHIDDLSRMQLIVIPVTHRLLNTPNRTVNSVLPYSLEHHLPVLPILWEKPSRAEYAAVFGALQYLDPSDNDPTAISFNDKLSNYLKRVLVGDELAEQIRAAFDAYVFISYRQKDRAAAQDLMRLIHSDPLCRDVALWYDEFLVPGESFRDSIRQAMEKCTAFILSVTPNLVNEENFVMNKEYPAACKLGLPVLPAEMRQTDRDLLEQHYEQIPPCCDPYNGSELHSALSELLNGVELLRSDGDSRHRFFIGLAYLAGIDTEVDHTQAVRLIRSAAENGLPEAMEKLSDMYRNGEALERDLRMSIHWRERLAVRRQEIFEQSSSAADGIAAFYALTDLGDACIDAEADTRALEVYQQALELAQTSHNEVSSQLLTYALGRMGEVYHALGNVERAMHYHRLAYSVRRSERSASGGYRFPQQLALSADKLGQLYAEPGDTENALLFTTEAYELQSGNPAPDDDDRLHRCIFGLRLGVMQENSGDGERALELYQQSYSEADRLAGQTLRSDAYRALALCCERLGDMYMNLRSYADARILYRRYSEITERLAKESGLIGAMLDHSIAIQRLGYAEEADGDARQAYNFYLRALEEAESICRISRSPASRRHLMVSCTRLGMLLAAEGERSAARSYYDRAFSLGKELVDEVGSDEALWDNAGNINRISDLLVQLKDYPPAERMCREAMSIVRGLYEKTGSYVYQSDLSGCCQRLGDLLTLQYRFDEAKQSYLEMLSLCREILFEHESPIAWANVVACYDKLRVLSHFMHDSAAEAEYARMERRAEMMSRG